MKLTIMSKSNNTKRKIHPPTPRVSAGVLKRLYYRFLRIRATPQQMSLGLALGIFVGMSPFIGFHTAIAVMLASVFKWSKIAAGVGVFVTNPLTAPLIYPLTYKLGAVITGFSEPIQWFKLFEQGGFVGMMKNSPLILVDMIVGGAIIGVPLSVITYYITFQAVLAARKRMERRKAQRKKKMGSPKKKPCNAPI